MKCSCQLTREAEHSIFLVNFTFSYIFINLIPHSQYFNYISESKWHSESKWLSHVQLFLTPWTIESMEFSRLESWSGQPFPSPGDLPNPGIEPRSPELQVDALPAEPQGKPQNTGVGSLSLLQGISQPRSPTLQVDSLPESFVNNQEKLLKSKCFISPSSL